MGLLNDWVVFGWVSWTNHFHFPHNKNIGLFVGGRGRSVSQSAGILTSSSSWGRKPDDGEDYFCLKWEQIVTVVVVGMSDGRMWTRMGNDHLEWLMDANFSICKCGQRFSMQMWIEEFVAWRKLMDFWHVLKINLMKILPIFCNIELGKIFAHTFFCILGRILGNFEQLDFEFDCRAQLVKLRKPRVHQFFCKHLHVKYLKKLCLWNEFRKFSWFQSEKRNE